MSEIRSASFTSATRQAAGPQPGALGDALALPSRLATQAILIAGDAGAFAAACLLLSPLRPARLDAAEFARVAALVALAVLVLHGSEKLYPGYRLQPHEQLRRRAVASFKAALLAAAATALLSAGWHLGLLVAGMLACALALQPLTRWLAMHLCRQLGLWGERVIVIADAERGPALVDYFRRRWQYGLYPEAFLPAVPETRNRNGPSTAVIAYEAAPPLAELAAARRQFAEVILLADTPCMKVAGLRPADIDGEIGIRLAAGVRRPPSPGVSRAIDLAIAVPAVLLFLPFMLLAATAIYAADPGPVLFRQAREGLAGRTVHVLKLRTMYRDAAERLEALLAADPAAAAEWARHFKLRRDPRVLPLVGGLLRSTSFDELPQLLNVIAGDMSIVGPRPFPEYHLNAMNAEFRHKRRSVTPGLTGLWQISERGDADLDLQRQLDEFYIDNRSLWFDWHILLSTIPAVFRRSGAY